MKPNISIAVSLIVTTVLLSGCTAPTKAADASSEKPKAAKGESSQDQPVQYSSVGSWIPRKIKKKEDVIGTNTQTVEGEALQKINDRNSTIQPKDGPAPVGR